MDQLDNAVIVAAEEVESEGSCPGQLSRSPSPGQGREAGRVSRSPSPGRKDSRGSHGSSSYDEEGYIRLTNGKPALRNIRCHVTERLMRCRTRPERRGPMNGMDRE